MRTRTTTAALAVAATVLALTACAPGSSTVNGCTPVYESGAASRQIEVTGDVGEMPDVSFDFPVVSEGNQASYSGVDGDSAGEGDIVDTDYSVYLGTTGDLMTTSFEGAEIAAAQSGLRLTAGEGTVLSEAVQCASAGSRVVLTTTVGDLFGEQASDPASDIDASDTAIVVLDVTATHPGRAEGLAKPGIAGMPSLALAPDGRPGITFPGSDAPADLVVTTTIQGDGPVVEDGQSVLVHYTGVVWESETVFDSSWEKGSPAEFTLTQDAVIDGFHDAIVGQQVGSQVMVSIPESEGYSDPATRPASIPEGAHLLFVIDILSAE